MSTTATTRSSCDERLRPKTQALLDEQHARCRDRQRVTVTPKLDQAYCAGDLPPGSVVRASFSPTEYVIGQTGCLMRWEQPICSSEVWIVVYTGRLPGHGRDLPDDDGRWMTPRERAEVDEARAKRDAQAWARDARP